MRKSALFVGLSVLSLSVLASDASLKSQLERVGATNVSIGPTSLPGFRLAKTDQGVLYISNDGRFFIEGNVYELKNGKAVNLSNSAMLQSLNAQGKNMIAFPAANQKYIVNVFMDITCHYCHLLFKQVKAYNDLGITLRFLAYPRGGLNTQTARQMEAIWSAANPRQALTDAENGKLPTQLKAPNIVKQQYVLGNQFGVSGTPTLVTGSGQVIPGYLPPKELLEALRK